MAKKTKKILALSRTSTMHYGKLIFRSGLFLVAAFIYIKNKIAGSGASFGGLEQQPVIMGFIWIVFVVEMILRLFPSSIESKGCQKQFKRNYIKSEDEGAVPKLPSRKRVLAVVVAWFALNGIFAVLYFAGTIDYGFLLLLSLAYSVCDMICILFFCPFQTWFLKHKCCTSCRIYNWDYAMMFTPLIFIRSLFTWSIVAVSLILLIWWELSVYLHPERFSEETNLALSCENCEEKLCFHKKQLKRFLYENKEWMHLKGNPIIAHAKESVGRAKGSVEKARESVSGALESAERVAGKAKESISGAIESVERLAERTEESSGHIK